MRLSIAAIACAAIAFAVPAAASEIDDRISELASRYAERPEPASRAELASLSDDVAVRSGDWTLLSRKYAIAFLPDEVRSVPTPARLAAWWDSLGDDMLTLLIRRALNKNRDLASARASVVEARAALGISRAALLPWLDASGSWTDGDPSENGTQAAMGAYDLSRLTIDASWEIDIFGGRQAAVDAAIADLGAAYAALHSTWVSLAAEVALNYIDLCTLHERLKIANENIALQSETLDMLQSRYDSGLTDALALSQAQYTLEQTRASIPPIEASIEATMNALAILVGEVPGSLGEMLQISRPIPKPDPMNLIGIPAEVLRRRPDIVAAELRYIAQTARTRQARADLLPKFTLIGSIGLESFSTGSLFKSGSYGFSVGPAISWPIFHAGAIRRNIKVQTAREERLLASYEQTVLQAVAEVRNALASHEQEMIRDEALARGVAAARTALEVAQDKYRNGLSDFNNVIGAQAALLSLQDQYVVSAGSIASSTVRLFKALGGGWEPLAEEEGFK